MKSKNRYLQKIYTRQGSWRPPPHPIASVWRLAWEKSICEWLVTPYSYICDAPSENHDMDYLTIFIVAFSVVNDN